jgi:putative FmdB family regulatory protein
MPTYDYVCKKCEHAWEEFQPITSKPKRKCPDCGKLSAKRLIGAGAGIIFKGSGFYQTDYRSSSYKKDAAADKKAQKKASGKSDSKSSSSDSKSSKKSD